jgi:acetyl-CoA acetyltransferase
MNDGTSSVILMSEEKAAELGLESMSEVKSCKFVGGLF